MRRGWLVIGGGKRIIPGHETGLSRLASLRGRRCVHRGRRRGLRGGGAMARGVGRPAVAGRAGGGRRRDEPHGESGVVRRRERNAGATRREQRHPGRVQSPERPVDRRQRVGEVPPGRVQGAGSGRACEAAGCRLCQRHRRGGARTGAAGRGGAAGAGGSFCQVSARLDVAARFWSFLQPLVRWTGQHHPSHLHQFRSRRPASAR